MNRVIHIPSLVIATALAAAASLTQAASLNGPINQAERAALFPSADMISEGRDVAKATCAGCHGMDGIAEAEGTPHLAGQRTVYLYRAQKAYNDNSRDDENEVHKSYLNEEALLSVAAYYANLAPAPVFAGAATTETLKPTGQVDTSIDDPFLTIREPMRKCVKCHGQSGNSSRSGVPNLTGQDPEYFRTSMLAYVDGTRNHKLMGKLVGDLDEATIRDLGVFYAVQEPQKTKTQGDGDFNVGRRLSESCQACHGDDGNAKKASMPTLAGQDAKYFVKGMTHYKDGTRQNSKMFEAVVKLSEQDMLDLATYYAAQEPRRREDVRAPLKSTEWIQRCERCHGIDGNSRDPRYPMLAGQDKTYLKNTMKDYAAGNRENTTMHAMGDPLSAMDIERISAYFALQPPKAVVYMLIPCEDDQQD